MSDSDPPSKLPPPKPPDDRPISGPQEYAPPSRQHQPQHNQFPTPGTLLPSSDVSFQRLEQKVEVQRNLGSDPLRREGRGDGEVPGANDGNGDNDHNPNTRNATAGSVIDSLPVESQRRILEEIVATLLNGNPASNSESLFSSHPPQAIHLVLQQFLKVHFLMRQ